MMRLRLVVIAALLNACGDNAVTAVATINPANPSILAHRGQDIDDRTATDFEDFSLGTIDGQFDWQSRGGTGAPTGNACAVYDHVIDASPASWRNGPFGRRTLRISNAVTSGCYSDQTFSARSADIAGQAGSVSSDGPTDYALPGAVRRNHFDASWTVASSEPAARQAGLEAVVSPARGDAHRMSWLRMADADDGLMVTFAERSLQADPGAFVLATVARGLDRRLAHRVRLSIDFVDGPANDVVRVYVDGVLRHVGTSWETYYALDPNGRANCGGASPAVNRIMFRTGSDTHRGVAGVPAPSTLGRGFLFDHVQVAAYDVPLRAADCRDAGWRVLRDAAGLRFTSQGACMSQMSRTRER